MPVANVSNSIVQLGGMLGNVAAAKAAKGNALAQQQQAALQQMMADQAFVEFGQGVALGNQLRNAVGTDNAIGLANMLGHQQPSLVLHPREMTDAECDALVAQRNAQTRKVEAESWAKFHQQKARQLSEKGGRLMRRIKAWAFVARFLPLLDLYVELLVCDLVEMVAECEREMALAAVEWAKAAR